MFFKALARFICELTREKNYDTIERALTASQAVSEDIFLLFSLKFDPQKNDLTAYHALKNEMQKHKDTFIQHALLFIDTLLKTNYFLPEKSALGFRLDPRVLAGKFATLPYGLFFVYAPGFFGFHIRFQDLARGGLRTVIPRNEKEIAKIAPTILTECYDLALTQQKKNKDIPEGGAKGIVFISSKDHLYTAQKMFIETLLSLVNCNEDGTLKLSPYIIDYHKLPEYLYLGPDEYMHDSMIEWIADYSKKMGYKPGSAFISGKPELGINHKQYGVTSLGVTVCMDAVLHYLGLKPKELPFTVKMAGGPDGDVAGNQILNFYKYYPNTAKLITLIDVSGLIHDPQGLDLGSCVELFKQGRPIRFYPKEKLSADGFLLDKEMRKGDEIELAKNQNGILEKIWLSEKDADELLLWHVHKQTADVFIPAGGRPATLNSENVKDFLDAQGQVSSKAIIEGANLYLTNDARRYLEKRGVIIIKDSSANKGGVICSSFEVLASLVLTESEFTQKKEILVQEILERITKCVDDEVLLILKEHTKTNKFCCEISEEISDRINSYASQVLEFLAPIQLPQNADAPELACFFAYVLPFLRCEHKEALMRNIPESHKKAIIATYIASKLVYKNGLELPHHIFPLIPQLLLNP